MKTSVAGYPRIGSSRELKVAVEQYFRGKMAPEALLETGSRLRRTHWQKQMEAGIDGIPSNDFSFYDQMLDTAVLLNAVPQRYRDLGNFLHWILISRWLAAIRGRLGMSRL